MTEIIDTEAIEPGQDINIDHFLPEDAPGVAALFKAVYGEGYPVKTYYHPEELIKAVEAGEINPAVARTAKHDIVGTVSLYRTAPYDQVYEGGAGLVLPSYRRHGLNSALNKFLLIDVSSQIDATMVFGEPVCNHVFQQKDQARSGFVTTTLEIALMPAAAYDREKSATGRVAALIAFKVFKPRPHLVFLPECYEEQLRTVYDWSGLRREFAGAPGGEPPRQSTVYTTRVFDFAKVARIAVPEIGRDFDQALKGEVGKVLQSGMEVVQVWLPLSDPGVGNAAEALRGKGFIFGGMLPRWFDGDGMLMQRVAADPNWEDIHLYSEEAKKLLDMIHSEWLELS